MKKSTKDLVAHIDGDLDDQILIDAILLEDEFNKLPKPTKLTSKQVLTACRHLNQVAEITYSCLPGYTEIATWDDFFSHKELEDPRVKLKVGTDTGKYFALRMLDKKNNDTEFRYSDEIVGYLAVFFDWPASLDQKKISILHDPSYTYVVTRFIEIKKRYLDNQLAAKDTEITETGLEQVQRAPSLKVARETTLVNKQTNKALLLIFLVFVASILFTIF